MRIMHLLNHTQPSNGHVHVAVDLACVQSRMGHSVSVVSGGGSFDPIFAAYGVEHIVIDQRRTLSNLIRAIFKLRAAILSFYPDVIHTHMMASTALALVLRPIMKFKLVTTVHNDFDRLSVIMGLGDRVIAVSQAVADNMERRGVRRSKLSVVLNGTIGSPRLTADPQPAKIFNRPAITFVGGLHPRKGIDDLIIAFKTVCSRAPTAFLYLIGNGPYRQTYEKLANQTGFGERIQFCGYQADPRPYLLASDLFVLASHAEPAGLVLTEARDAGCAIIATSVGGIPEMLDGGEAGVLIPPRRSDLLAEAILKALGNTTILAQMRARSQLNLKHFTVDRVSEEYISVYKSA
jgi:glycosyltransferase involved in cell wall biosynthesis